MLITSLMNRRLPMTYIQSLVSQSKKRSRRWLISWKLTAINIMTHPIVHVNWGPSQKLYILKTKTIMLSCSLREASMLRIITVHTHLCMATGSRKRQLIFHLLSLMNQTWLYSNRQIRTCQVSKPCSNQITYSKMFLWKRRPRKRQSKLWSSNRRIRSFSMR
jgi:hypothetical protein